MVASAVYPGLERKPGGPDNWVEAAHGLPKYIERIAKHLHYERGFSISRAIATAVNTVKRWARGGTVTKHGTTKRVSAKTIAQAAAAVASWNAKRRAGALALTDAEFAVIDLTEVGDDFACELLTLDFAEENPRHLRPQKCKYCSNPATKSILHSEGMAYIPVCQKHLNNGKKDAAACVPSGGPDPSNINKIYDLTSDGGGSADEPARGILRAMDIKALAERANAIEDPVARGRARQAVLDLAVPKSELTKEKRDQRAKSGEAMPDGSFPIFDRTSLKSAIGLARTSAQRAHVVRRAKALGLTSMLPDTWNMDLAHAVLSAVIDLASTIAPRNARGLAKDGRRSYKKQGKWKHGFIPVDAAAHESKAKGSPIAMKRTQRLYGSAKKSSASGDTAPASPAVRRGKSPVRVEAARGRAGQRSAAGRVKSNPKGVKVDEKSRPGSESAQDVAFLRHSAVDAATNREAKGASGRATSQKEASKETRIPERARQNWDEIPETLKTVRGGKKFVVAEFGGKQYITEWVGGVSEVAQTAANKRKVMRTLSSADAANMSQADLRALINNPRTPSSVKKVARAALRGPVKKKVAKSA